MAAFGLKPWGALLDRGRYQKGTAATAVFIQDVCSITADGIVEAAAAIATGIMGANLTYSAASVQADIVVADCPSQKFEIEHDGTATETMNGLTADHVAGTGSATTLLSGHDLDTSDANVGDGGFLILENVLRIGNTLGAQSDAIVRMVRTPYNVTTGL